MAIELHLHNVNLSLQIDDAGTRHVALIDDRSGIVFHLAMAEADAHKLATALTGSPVIVAPANALEGI